MGCKRIKRKLEREPNRKVTIATGTRSLRIVDAVIYAYPRRNGLDDLDKLLGPWVNRKTIVADTEFDAEKRFHRKVLALGGKGVAPLRHKKVPVWRTKGARRKQLRRRWPGRSYRRRPLTETANSMLKKGHGRNIAWPHRLAASQTFLCEMLHTQHIIEVQLMELAIEP
ncbi:MAG: hypothetical protein ABH879_05905 [archaeon]